MVWFVRSDPCGLVCGLVTYVIILFAWCVQFFLVMGPWCGYFSWHMTLYTFLSLLGMLSHIRAQFSDPGAVPIDIAMMEQEEIADSELVVQLRQHLPTMGEQEKPLMIKERRECHKCRSWKPLDAHHCSTCKRCIMKLDHRMFVFLLLKHLDCVWANNCMFIFD